MLAVGRKDAWASSFVMFRSASSKQGDLVMLTAALGHDNRQKGKKEKTKKANLSAGLTGYLGSLAWMAVVVRTRLSRSSRSSAR